ncbi:DUF2789 domain-containing protein [Pseudomonas sp. 7P_10.2_Bac1]|uniref:DUF2789 domain-containing protein n=1 Tax=Pseudomonas sp. 7P_10.2_Bac1 TaxID=2971614 RepID=UPI0021C8E118|nr:DUF2789 domain-containing protein [Pseudomonas sp. 7P_10.2_Bac1]MCU1729711.1 DUF2789 domain-containing protein [Pseudomonas sp. 7P_10.2_Bac1]
MDDTPITLQALFEQLGLDADEQSINNFFRDTPTLAEDVKLADAPFWTPAQSQFLKEKIGADDNWALVIDELNERLHQAR